MDGLGLGTLAIRSGLSQCEARKTMTCHSLRFVFLLFCLASTLERVSAQASTDNKSSSSIQKQSAANALHMKDEDDQLSEAQRLTVLAIASSLADEARGYRDEALRVRVQARVAEVLWETERDRARLLFNRAWETANAVDKAGEQRVKEDRIRFAARPDGPTFIPSPPNLRLEVLRFVSRCDRELSEKFLASIQQEREKDATELGAETSPVNRWDPTEPPSIIKKRLELGMLLLERGEVRRALEFADPALVRVTQPAIIFLYKLQQKDAAAANERFAAFLSRAMGDRFADANTISLLATYAFTPLVFATVTFNGRAYGGEAVPPPALPRELRDAFFRSAAQVLLRPLPPPDQDLTSAGRAGTYFTIARLLPLFQQYAPDFVPQLGVHLTSLAQDTPLPLRDDDEMRTVGFSSETLRSDDLNGMSDRLRSATSSIERDRIYVGALRDIVKTDPPRARAFADKIENADLRKGAIAFVDFVAIRSALERTNLQEALRIVRAGNLPHIQRVWAYTEITRLIKADPAGVIQLLNEAAAEARRIDQSSPQRAQALTAIATRLLEVDRGQAWETMAEAVKAAGYAGDFKGEDGKVTSHLQTGLMIATFDLKAPSFDLSGMFSSLARDDFQRAIELARRFTAEEPRAIATLAIVQSILNKKPKQSAAGR